MFLLSRSLGSARQSQGSRKDEIPIYFCCNENKSYLTIDVFVERLVWTLHTALNFPYHLCAVSTGQVLLSKFSTELFPRSPGYPVVAVPEQSFTSE